MTKTAIYTRVSTGEQSVEPQLKEIYEYISHRPDLEIVAKYSDVMSGAKKSRPGMDKLIEDAKAGKFEVVMAVKLDRLARSLSNFAALMVELDEANVSLLIPGQAIDTTNQSPCGKFQMAVLAAVAQLERDFIRERVTAGLAVARDNGVKLGRPSKKLVENSDAVIQQWRIDKGTYRDLSQRLGGVSVATAYKMAQKD
jgi:DNA invertase Pin-like site-specific DNA recombinase